jgi:hypothetical protein
MSASKNVGEPAPSRRSHRARGPVTQKPAPDLTTHSPQHAKAVEECGFPLRSSAVLAEGRTEFRRARRTIPNSFRDPPRKRFKPAWLRAPGSRNAFRDGRQATAWSRTRTRPKRRSHASSGRRNPESAPESRPPRVTLEPRFVTVVGNGSSRNVTAVRSRNVTHVMTSVTKRNVMTVTPSQAPLRNERLRYSGPACSTESVTRKKRP